MSFQVFLKNYKSDYKKLSKLGSGSYGTVYRVQNIQTGEIYAAKVFSDDFRQKNAIEELSVLRTINSFGYHENIIYPLAIYNSAKIAVILPFAGKTLSFWNFANKSVDQSTIKIIMFQILKALFYIHSLGIIHRDIKSANLLINDSLEIVLIDFGLSKFVFDTSLPLEHNVQTAPYRSLELLLSVDKYGPEVDIWALGCVMAEIMTGRFIFGSKTEEVISNLCTMEGDVGSLSAIPEYIKCRRIMNKVPPISLENLLKIKNNKVYQVKTDDLIILKHMLCLDPDKRWTSRRLLQHEYFDTCRSKISLNMFSSKIGWLLNNQYLSLPYNIFPFPPIFQAYDYIIGLWVNMQKRDEPKTWLVLYSAFDILGRVLLCKFIRSKEISGYDLTKYAHVCFDLSLLVNSSWTIPKNNYNEREYHYTQTEVLNICKFNIIVPTIGHFLKYYTGNIYMYSGVLVYIFCGSSGMRSKEQISKDIDRLKKLMRKKYKYYHGCRHKNIRTFYNEVRKRETSDSM
jgi:serine/threonine protein kinase